MKRTTALLLIALFFLLSGCASRENARFIYTQEAEGSFLEGGRIDNYDFYIYGGPGFQPVAYLALDKRYILQTQFWDPTAMSLSRWQEIYRAPSSMREDRYQVRAIVTPDAQTIGYILTRYYEVFAWKVEPGPNTILVPPPSLSPMQPEYRRNEYDD